MNKIFPLILNSLFFISGILCIVFDHAFLCALCLLAISILFLWANWPRAVAVPSAPAEDAGPGSDADDSLQMELSLRIQELTTSNQLLNEEIEHLRSARQPCPHPLYTCPLTSSLPINLDNFFTAYIKSHFDPALKNKIRPEYHCSIPDAETFLSAGALTLICDNVLDNMLKFSPGSETIYIRITDLDHDSLLIFKNEGEGVTESETNLVFDLNYQGSNKKTGSGLGLAQVKALVEDYGGHAWAKSSKNAGFTLYIRLPAKHGLPPASQIQTEDNA